MRSKILCLEIPKLYTNNSIETFDINFKLNNRTIIPTRYNKNAFEKINETENM